MKKVIALVVLVMVFVLAMAGCGEDEKPQEEHSGTEIVITPSEDTPQNSVPEEVLSGEPVVHTEYGDLIYHEQWLGFMKTEQKKEGETLTVSFIGEAEGENYYLFDIIIGTSEEAIVGEITDSSGNKRDVYAKFYDLEQYTDVASEDFDRLCAMQEDLNNVINNLK